MKRVFIMLAVAVAVAVCCLGQSAVAGDYYVYVSSSQATAGDTDRILTYDQDGALLWSKGLFATEGFNMIGLALHTNDLIYTTAWDGGWMLRYDRTAGEYAGGGRITAAGGSYSGNTGRLTMGPDGYIYVITTGNGVVKLDPISLSGSVLVAGTTFRDVAFNPADPNGYLYIVTSTGIQYHDRNSGAWIGDFITGYTKLAAMVWRGGDAYVSDKGPNAGGDPWNELDGSIQRFDGIGTPLGAFVTSGSGSLKNPEGLVFTPDNKLLVCDYYPDHIVHRYNGSTGAYIDDFATPPDSGWCRSIAVVAVTRDDLYYSYVVGPQASPGSSDRLLNYDHEGALLWQSTDSAGTPNHGYLGVTVGPDNQYVYVTQPEAASGSQGAYNVFNRGTGAYIKHFGLGANQPGDVTFGPDGNMYMILFGKGVYKVTDPYNLGGIAQFTDTVDLASPAGLAFGPDGNLYVCSTTTIGKYDGSTGAWIGTFATGGAAWQRLTWHGGKLYVSEKHAGGGGQWETEDGAVDHFAADGTPLGEFVTAGSGGMENPEAIRFTPNGRYLLVCDYYFDGIVRRYNGYTGKFADLFIDPIDGLWPRGIEVWEIPARGTLIMVQ